MTYPMVGVGGQWKCPGKSKTVRKRAADYTEGKVPA